MRAVERELAAGVRLGYRPELDGLRAIAVTLVLIHHYWVGSSVAPFGFLGVDVFFVLSGFLITRLLLEERSRTGTIALSAFYVRRAARLLPALGVLLAVVALDALTLQVLGDTSSGMIGVGSSLGYFTNWMLVSGDTELVLSHLWSLSVEEQFYLIWPAVMIATCRRWGISGARWTAACIALVAGVQMMIRSYAGVGWLVLNFSTDTRAAVMLLCGCALATVSPTSSCLRTHRLGLWSRWLTLPTAVACAIVVFRPMIDVTTLFRGGCQGPAGSAHRRPVVLPAGGHRNCPLMASGTAQQVSGTVASPPCLGLLG